MNGDNELENIQIDREIRARQAADVIRYPDQYPGVDFRTAQVECPKCHQVIPYRGCAFHKCGGEYPLDDKPYLHLKGEKK